jgi:hypothetical protein
VIHILGVALALSVGASDLLAQAPAVPPAAAPAAATLPPSNPAAPLYQHKGEQYRAAGVSTQYATVPGGTHLEAYLTYAAQLFDFLDKHRK